MSTISTALARFTTNVRAIITAGAARMKSLRDTDSFRALDVFRTFIVGTGGPQSVGSSGDLVATNLGQSTSVYVHLKLPLRNTQGDCEFNLRMDGYSYGEGKIISVSWTGGLRSGVLTKNTVGTHTANVYLDGNGYIIVSIFFTTCYYATFHVEAMCNSDAKRVVRGQLQGRVALTSTLTF